MTRRFIFVSASFAQWRQDPEYRVAYEALEEEFAWVRALIEARARTGLTQEEVAQPMGTTPAAIARLEGRRVRPSTRTLERFTQATGTRLKISFEPAIPQSIS